MLVFTSFEPDYSIFPQYFLYMSIKPCNESEVCLGYKVQIFVADPFLSVSASEFSGSILNKASALQNWRNFLQKILTRGMEVLMYAEE